VSKKIRELEDLKERVEEEKRRGKKVVFTNGCFDLLHRGHLHLLREAKKLGDILIVAINSDDSVKRIKGPNRPVRPLAERADLLASLDVVDYVIWFDDIDPRRILKELRPNVLVKGGDWLKNEVVGADLIEQDGGEVTVIPYLEGHSTTHLIERIRQA
jgi:D-beta-D-heptose 7-phosphate kinase/D-beta-D-heptose 1-phosphate adenosyltransferase